MRGEGSVQLQQWMGGVAKKTVRAAMKESRSFKSMGSKISADVYHKLTTTVLHYLEFMLTLLCTCIAATCLWILLDTFFEQS